MLPGISQCRASHRFYLGLIDVTSHLVNISTFYPPFYSDGIPMPSYEENVLNRTLRCA